MKKRIGLFVMAVFMIVGLTGCTKTKTVSNTDENGNTTTTTTTTTTDGETTTVETTTVTEDTDTDENVTSPEENSYITASLKFINLSGVDIYELYIVPDYSDDWGDNIINESSAPLADGESIEWNNAFTYSEDDLIWDIRAVDGDGEEMDFSGLDVSLAEDKNNIEFTFEYNSENGYTASVIGPINQEHETEYSVIESADGYRLTYNPEYFIYEDGSEGEYEGKDSTYLRCTIDKEHEYENYIDVSVVNDYTAKDLIEGIAFQNETEATSTHIVFANGKEYDAYYCERPIADAFYISFYVIDGKDAPYLIEVGNHIYSDDDEYAYYVAGAMEEIFLDLDFEQ